MDGPSDLRCVREAKSWRSRGMRRCGEDMLELFWMFEMRLEPDGTYMLVLKVAVWLEAEIRRCAGVTAPLSELVPEKGNRTRVHSDVGRHWTFETHRRATGRRFAVSVSATERVHVSGLSRFFWCAPWRKRIFRIHSSNATSHHDTGFTYLSHDSCISHKAYMRVSLI